MTLSALKDMFVVRAAPAPVTSLTLQSNGSQDALKAAWIPAVGRVESYQLSLSPSISSQQDLILPPNTTQWVFSGLTPGKDYQVLVKTKSGELTAETRTTGRTGKNDDTSYIFLPYLPLNGTLKAIT